MIRHTWQEAAAECRKQAEPFVLVTVVGTTGSTPREGGSKMVVTSTGSFDTMGGGRLEFLCIQKARELLAKGAATQRIAHFPLAASAEQCCGGSVTVLFEVFPRTAMEVVVFGAGHVGSALIRILGELDMRVSWVDSRGELFPEVLPSAVGKQVRQDPVDYVDSIPAGASVVIVTHDHALDYRLTRAILERSDDLWPGLIGSETKARRFRKRLQHDGFPQEVIDRLVCPIGLPGVGGKLPMEVAVSIAAQLLSIRPASPGGNRQGLGWKEIRELITTESL